MKPSLVFIHTDSWDGRLLGCLGHPALKGATPNLDALAASGTLFRQTCSNNPICVPSRSSTWSGQYTHHCEGWNNYKGLEPGTPTFLDQFTKGGFRTKVLGKTDYLSGKHTIRARVSPWTRSANLLRPNYRMEAPELIEDRSPRTMAKDWADVDAACRWLAEEAPRGRDPFFLYLGIRAPHPPFLTSRHWLDRIPEDAVDVPPADENPHPSLAYQRVNKNWQHGFSDDQVRFVRRIYFAMIAEVDAMVGEVLRALRAALPKAPVHVVFSSDHGEMAMEHRQFYKCSLYEPSVRVPLILQGPGVRAGATVDRPASLVDLYPTFMDMAGLPCPAGLDGHSLLPEARGEPSKRPDWAFAECHDSSCNTGFFMLRRDGWKYLVYAGSPPQLFRPDEDRWEIRDLAPSRPDKVAEMDRLLRSIVDYEEVDRRAKAHDRAAFRKWRDEQRAAGTYAENMSRVFSGWDRLPDAEVQPWTADDERAIEAWLGAA